MSGLTRSDIDDILKLIDGSDFDELKLEMGDVKLEVRRGAALQPVAPVVSEPTPDKVTPQAAVALSEGGGTGVPAPLLGTFYRSPKPGADPFVAVGDTVTENTIIAIIEVMKLMNSVPAGIAGVVTEIIAADGDLVEHGQTIIRVQPA